jgi:hypothetical protein
MKRLSSLILCTAMLAACTPAVPQKPEQPPVPPVQQEPLSLEQTAEDILMTLKSEDIAAFAQYVHPVDGVRFTPYTYVQESDIVLLAENIVTQYEGDTVYTWGSFDGSGDPIGLTFSQYIDQFVWTQDFTQAEDVLWDDPQSRGNGINNAVEFYGPEARIVEYHFPGFDPQYEGMDWQSLRLVLKQHDGNWKLVGIIHDQWTI